MAGIVCSCSDGDQHYKELSESWNDSTEHYWAALVLLGAFSVQLVAVMCYVWFINRNDTQQMCYASSTVTNRFLEYDDEHNVIN